MNLLIVDDEKAAVKGLLPAVNWKRLGILKLYTAFSMDEAISQFQSHSIDILLTDIEMPGGNGFDLIRWTKACQFSCLYIILSGFPNFHYAQRAITLGVFEYLLKPVEDSVLESSIQKAVATLTQQDILKEPPPEEPFILSIKNYIYEHISREISRNELANEVGLSPAYLSTYFKKETGLTISDFIKQERIAFAKRLLRQTNLPVSVISQNVGYDSLSYFSSVFHENTGYTPREYRNNWNLESEKIH